MKKILFLSLFVLGVASFFTDTGFGAKSQATLSHTTFNPTGAITNAGVDTMSIILTRGYSLISIQPVVVRNSGTLAGTVQLAYSVTGVAGTWVDADIQTLTNVAKSVATVWTKAIPVRYWRIITTGSGTMTASTTARLQTD